MNKKLYICITAAGLMMTACNSDEILSDDSSKDQTTELSGFNGTISDELDILDTEGCDGEDAGETRSTISGGVFSSWSENDVVSISDGTLSYKYKPTAINGTQCTFEVLEGNNQFDQNLKQTDNFYVFYPAAAVDGWNGATANTTVYAMQDYNENIDNGVMGAYMGTKADINEDGSHVSFSFKHCCSVIEVNLSTLGVTPKRVSIKSNDNVSLSGKIYYDIANNAIQVESSDATGFSYSTQSNVVTLGNIAANATTARFYILPVYISNGLTITVEDTDGNFYTKQTSTAIGNQDTNITMKETNGTTTTVPPAKPYYKKINFGVASDAKRKGDWMATIPGNVWLHMLSIPGAHDAGTWELTGSSTANQMSYCQSLDIQGQLNAGVRAFDLRVPYCGLSAAPTTATVNLYHGMVNCNVLFKDAMDYLVSFVKNHPTETVIVICNKENSTGNILVPGTNTSTTDYSLETDGGCAWQASIRDYLDGTYKDESTVDNTITGSRADYFITDVSQQMRLNNCRGKILFLSRNYYGETQSATTPVYGGVIRMWGDNESIEATIYKTNASEVCKVYIQDEYNADNTTTKQTSVKTCLDASVADNTNKFYINFVSMAKSFSVGGGSAMYPKTNATTMNSAIATLLDNYTGKTGLMFFDFCGDETYNGKTLQTKILNQNYKYIFKNRSRISATSNSSTGAVIAGDEYADDSEVFAKPLYRY